MKHRKRKLTDARLAKINRILARDAGDDWECPGPRVVLTDGRRGELTDANDPRTRATEKP